ncbi:MAG TPA: hypothetical protein VIL57_03280 [Bacteroidia bacterium]
MRNFILISFLLFCTPILSFGFNYNKINIQVVVAEINGVNYLQLSNSPFWSPVFISKHNLLFENKSRRSGVTSKKYLDFRSMSVDSIANFIKSNYYLLLPGQSVSVELNDIWKFKDELDYYVRFEDVILFKWNMNISDGFTYKNLYDYLHNNEGKVVKNIQFRVRRVK